MISYIIIILYGKITYSFKVHVPNVTYKIDIHVPHLTDECLQEMGAIYVLHVIFHWKYWRGH